MSLMVGAGFVTAEARGFDSSDALVVLRILGVRVLEEKLKDLFCKGGMSAGFGQEIDDLAM